MSRAATHPHERTASVGTPMLPTRVCQIANDSLHVPPCQPPAVLNTCQYLSIPPCKSVYPGTDPGHPHHSSCSKFHGHTYMYKQQMIVKCMLVDVIALPDAIRVELRTLSLHNNEFRVNYFGSLVSTVVTLYFISQSMQLTSKHIL